MALYPEMVIATCRKRTAPCPTFQQSLSKGYGGWDVMAEHLLYGNVLVFTYICLIGGVLPLLWECLHGKQRQRIYLTKKELRQMKQFGITQDMTIQEAFERIK